MKNPSKGSAIRNTVAPRKAPPTPRAAAGGDGLKSLSKVVRVLECFSATDRALPLIEICRRAGLPKSSGHRVLAAMRAAGLLDQDQERERYRLGLRLFEFGNIALANMDIHREARPHVDALTRLARQTVHLAVFDGWHAVVIRRAEPQPEGTPITFLEAAPVHCTGVGKAILAFQPAPVIARILAAPLERFTEATITEPARLRANLAGIRAAGFAVDEGEHQPGLRCVAAPIRDGIGRVVAGISLSGPGWKLPATEIEAASRLVRHSARTISTALGYRPDTLPQEP